MIKRKCVTAVAMATRVRAHKSEQVETLKRRQNVGADLRAGLQSK